jgi:hypothetical protein
MGYFLKFFQKIAQSKYSPIGPKFAQSGHPGCLPPFFVRRGFFEPVPTLIYGQHFIRAKNKRINMGCTKGFLAPLHQIIT